MLLQPNFQSVKYIYTVVLTLRGGSYRSFKVVMSVCFNYWEVKNIEIPTVIDIHRHWTIRQIMITLIWSQLVQRKIKIMCLEFIHFHIYDLLAKINNIDRCLYNIVLSQNIIPFSNALTYSYSIYQNMYYHLKFVS